MPAKHGAPRPKAAASGGARSAKKPRKISTKVRVRCPMTTIEVRQKGGKTKVSWPDLTPFVKKGAGLLDERVPGWWRKIAVSTLQLSSPEKCVIGQLAIKSMLNGPLPDYFAGIHKLFAEVDREYDTYNTETRGNVAAEHGFAIPVSVEAWIDDRRYHDNVDHQNAMWEQLNDLWVAEIKERRASDKAAKAGR